MKLKWRNSFAALLLIWSGCASKVEHRSSSLQGRIVDIFGNPVPGCTISPCAWEIRGFDRFIGAFSSSRTWSSRTLPPSQSDADGVFACDSCDRSTKGAYTTIKVTKEGYVARDLDVCSKDQGNVLHSILLPSGDSLRTQLAGPNARTCLIHLLALPRIDLAKNYFAMISELRQPLLSLIGDAVAHPELHEVAQEAAFMLALNDAPEDRAIIDGWIVHERPLLGFLELALSGDGSVVGTDYPAGENVLTFNFQYPTFSVSQHDLLSKTEDDSRRLYLGQWFYFDPVGKHAEDGWWIAVLRKKADGCKVVFLSTVWVKRYDRYFGKTQIDGRN